MADFNDRSTKSRSAAVHSNESKYKCIEYLTGQIELAWNWQLDRRIFFNLAIVRVIYPRPREQFNGLSIQLCEFWDFLARLSFVFRCGLSASAGNLLKFFSCYCKN